MLNKKIDHENLRILTHDLVSSSIQKLVQCSQNFEDNIDAALFLIKNLYKIYDFFILEMDKSVIAAQHSEIDLNLDNYAVSE